MVKKVKFHAEEIKRIIREECTSLEEGAFSKMMAKAKGAFGVKSPEGKDADPASEDEENKASGDKESESGDSKDQSKPEASRDEPVNLFTGDGALKQRMFSGIKSKEGNLDKKKVEAIIMSVLKDLSSQLRANGLKVQESNNIYYPLLQILSEKSQPGDPTYVDDLTLDQEGDQNVKKSDGSSSSDQALTVMKKLYSKRAKGDVINFLPSKVGKVPQGAPMHKAALKKDASGKAAKLAKVCKDDPECAKQYKALRRANAELSKQYQAGGAEAEKSVRTGGRVKPQKGTLNVSQAIGGKLKSAGLEQKTITHLIVKKVRPYFQKLFKQRGIEDIKIKESLEADAKLLVEQYVRKLLKKEKSNTRSLKIKIKRNKK
jgi:hypothetical protein